MDQQIILYIGLSTGHIDFLKRKQKTYAQVRLIHTAYLLNGIKQATIVLGYRWMDIIKSEDLLNYLSFDNLIIRDDEQ